jgi:predicted DNA-binding protein
MPLKRERTNKMKTIKTSRTSVSFPVELYHTLEHLAKEKKVSVAWIVREAAEKYVADRHPLFNKSN